MKVKQIIISKRRQHFSISFGNAFICAYAMVFIVYAQVYLYPYSLHHFWNCGNDESTQLGDQIFQQWGTNDGNHTGTTCSSERNVSLHLFVFVLCLSVKHDDSDSTGLILTKLWEMMYLYHSKILGLTDNPNPGKERCERLGRERGLTCNRGHETDQNPRHLSHMGGAFDHWD